MKWQPKKLSRAQQEERRLEGGRLLRHGRMSQAEIARHLDVSPVAVAKWKQRIMAPGATLHVLRSTSLRGHRPRLSAQQWRLIKRLILKGAINAGFDSERWTLPRIQQLIEQRFDVRYTTAWLSIRLRQLGLSVQRPTTVARAKQDELAEAWLRSDWPTIKKALSYGADIMSADEFSVSFRDRPATTWAAVGRTPIVRREDKRRGLSCFCGLTVSGKLYTIYFPGSIDAEGVVVALRYIRRYLKGPVILIWDRLSAHRSGAVRNYLVEDGQMEVELLPAYSPELNPEEYCHGYAKERMRNSTPRTVEELLSCIEREFVRIRRRPKLMRSFFALAKIPIINLSG